MNSNAQRPRPRPRTTRRRKAAGLALAGLLGAACALVPFVPAHANDGPFSIDGQVADAGAVQVSDLTGNVKELGPKNASTTKIGVIHNAAVPMLDTTNPNAQVDLRRAWLATAREAGKDWLYFAWERDSNSGSGFIAFEFMQDPAPAACNYSNTDAQLIAACNPWKNRKAGDFMILWDQQGGGTDLFLRVWSGTAPNLTLGAPVQLNAVVSQAQYSADGFRGEAALNLTDTIFGGSTACRTFANVIPSTVTGNSDSADYKDTILQPSVPITNCAATLVTTPKTGAGNDIPVAGLSIGTGVAAVKDSALVGVTGGSATPAGSVAFSLCKVDAPGTCASGGTSVGSTNLSGASYPATVVSPTAYVTSAGRYCWRATFSGDAANGINPVTDSAATECFTVTPVTPTLSTNASDDVVVGGTVSDTATLSGTATKPATPVINLTGTAGPAADGSITFTLYGPSTSGCGSLAYTSAAVPVSGNGDYSTPSPQFAPASVGTYHWVASYSGSSPNTNTATHNTACDDTAEDVSTTSVPSSLTTSQSWIPNDSMTVSASAGGALAGTASFELFASADCTGSSIYSTTVAVAGTSPRTVGTSNTTPRTTGGSYSWQVSYDSTNPAQRDIGPSCHETSSLTIANGGTISSP